jgi:hypothetical protein
LTNSRKNSIQKIHLYYSNIALPVAGAEENKDEEDNGICLQDIRRGLLLVGLFPT